MATFVLVHGGWGGGWEWRLVADSLQRAGHIAYRPTLTGLGERRHLANPQVDLDTHIEDVVAVLQNEDLTDVVLVGQSYGGAVVTGVADRAPERLRHLVYVDAFVPDNGQSVNELSGAKFSQYFRDLAVEAGDGWQVPVWFSAEEQGLPDQISAWYMSHVSPHPLSTLDQPLRLTGAVGAVPTTYIDCEPPDAPGWVFRVFADKARSTGWDYHRFPVGHDAHVIEPKALALLLAQIAAV
jgi:pimeloyl-ACP methyl ester carboxylesterase